MVYRSDISVLIVTFNSRGFIRGCLESVAEAGDGENWKVIVVDNGSVDGSAEVAMEYPTVQVIRKDRNVGFAAGVNSALDVVDSEYLLLLNPDTVVTGGSIQTLKGYLDTNAEVACVAPQLLNFDGSIQSSCREFPTLKTILAEFFLLPGVRRRFPKLDRYRMGYFDHRSRREVDQPMASCMLLRKGVLDEIGRLDERMPIFFNDVDLCRRIKDKGWSIVFLPDARVYHYYGASTKALGVDRQLHLARSMYRYLKKYEPGLLAYCCGFFLIVGYLLRSVYSMALETRRG